MTREQEIKEMAKVKASHITSDKDMQVAFADVLRRGAVWADEHPRWISVEEELPPKDKAYLAYWQHLGVTKYRYVKVGAKVSRTFSEHITHWMPLPQPPKKGGEE